MKDPLRALPLNAIRVFEAAARLESFTRAAEELGITQAAVSWQVKALERRLDVALFRRRERRVTLTPAGQRLGRAATEAMHLLRGALADLVDQNDGVLSISTLQSVAIGWLAPRLGAFQIASPGLAVRLDTSPGLVDLERDGIDVVLRSGSGEWPGLTSHFLFPASGVPLLSPELWRSLGPGASAADLRRLPLIGSGEEWAEWFAAAGAGPEGSPKPPRFTADTQAIEVANALAGQGVALGSPILFAAEIAQGRLAAPFQAAIPYSAGYWLAYRTERRRSPKIAAFRRWLLETVEAMGP